MPQYINFGAMKKSWQIFWHAFVWAALISLFLFLIASNTKMTTADALVILLYGAIDIALFYFNYLLLIPQFLDKKRYWVYALSIVITIVVFGLAKYGFALVFKEQILMREKGRMITFGAFFISTIFNNLCFLFLSVAGKYEEWGLQLS